MAYVQMSDLRALTPVRRRVRAAALPSSGMSDVAPTAQPSFLDSLPPTVGGIQTTYVILGVGTIGLVLLAAALKKKKPEYQGFAPQFYPPQYGPPQYAPPQYAPPQYYAPPPQAYAPQPMPPIQAQA